MADFRLVGPVKSVLQVTIPEDAEHDLLVNPAEPAAVGSHTLTNHGGSTIPVPRLVLVFLGGIGAWWGDWHRLSQFCTDLMTRGYLSELAAYGSGQGSFWGAVEGPLSRMQLKDSDLQGTLRGMIAAGQVPQPDGQTLYALVLPEGVTVSFDDGSGSNCTSFCGYHGALDARTFYSVHPAPQCGGGGGCTGGRLSFDAFTMVLSHEVAEACTDAVPGRGWFEDSTGAENADLVAWIDRSYGPYTVQGYWTNEQGNTVGAWQDAPSQPGPPPPSDCKTAALGVADAALAGISKRARAQRLGAQAVRDALKDRL